MKTELWSNLNTIISRTDVSAGIAGAVAGLLIGQDILHDLMRDPYIYSDLLAGFPSAGAFLAMWNPVAGGILAFTLARISSNMIKANSLDSDELMQARAKEEGFKYKVPEYPKTKGLQLTLGESHGGNPNTQNFIENPSLYSIPSAGLWGNIIAFGRIGSGKTQSVIYPLLENMLVFSSDDPDKKVGGLVLDVKGDFTATLIEYCANVKRDDVFVVRPDGPHVWNPIHSPDTSADALAGRLMAVYENLSGGSGSENAWVGDGIFKIIWHCIGIHRCVFGYVTIKDINTIINNTSGAATNLNTGDKENPTKAYIKNTYNNPWEERVTNEEEKREYNLHYDYFMGEWANEAEKTKSTYSSGATSITGLFAKPEIERTFCPSEDEITFSGFNDVIDKGSIVVLDTPGTIYGAQVSGAIGILLKLDFQRSALQRVARAKIDPKTNTERPLMMIIDEYQYFVTVSSQRTPEGDDGFYDKSRQSKCVSLLATQSPISLEAKVGKDKSRVILTNILTKISLGINDAEDAESLASLFGKSRQTFESYSLSENMTAAFNPATGNVTGDNTGVSQSSSFNSEETFIVQPTSLMQLAMFEAIVYASDGIRMRTPERVYLKPTFVPNDLKHLYNSPKEVPYNELIKSMEKAEKLKEERGEI